MHPPQEMSTLMWFLVTISEPEAPPLSCQTLHAQLVKPSLYLSFFKSETNSSDSLCSSYPLLQRRRLVENKILW